ncbi:diguanylate cyclase [Pleurocapsa sp. CCALA 161]|uniref:PAS domain S-box protein n=1 Tax=Pleurocapsa sp. CCALA 161 TaxID=2107688 RepID=UPI000D0565AC|nr:PAS domain S-box protein [Pleurocapsa sp. CCALA 161]PSB12851.1 diguanylate cyclase [Pleurocapsa sp. CCALA 161]
MAGAKKSPTKKLFLEAVYKHSSEAIAILDRQDHIVELNPAACKLFGATKKKLIGKLIGDFLLSSIDSQQVQKRAKIQLKQPQGKTKVAEYSLVKDFLPHHNLLVFRDITDSIQQEATELNLHHQRVELFAEVTLKIRQSLQLPEILQTAVSEVQRILQADRVLIYQVFSNGTGMPIKEAVLPDFKPILGVEFPEEVFPADYRQLYTQGRIRAIANVHAPDAGLAECLIEFMKEWQIKSKLVVPILQNTKSSSKGEHLWGLLIAHQCQAPREWTEFEQELMQQLADQIGIALFQGELLENLEGIVAERTAKLRQEISERQAALRERTKAETALRHSEEQLRLIANGLPVLIAYVDCQQHYRFNNQAYQTWLGLSPEEMSDRHLAQVHGKDEYQQISQYVATALKGETVTYERDLVLQDGCVHSLSVTYIPHLQSQNTIQGFFALSSDISDRKAIERMKDEFLSVVSHELRTPLTSIHSSLKILATGKLGSLSHQGKRMLKIADEQTERLVHLVNNVLDLQRIQSGKINMNKQACQTKELMVEAVQAMKNLAQEQGIQLSFKPNDLIVWADRDYIVQTLTNLVSNAIKFSPPKSTVMLFASPQKNRDRVLKDTASCSISSSGETPPTLFRASHLAEALPHRQNQSISYITFAVQDRGQGIPQDRLETIFERFQQVDSSDSRKKGGTGLGLAICRQIVEGHGGQIWAESGLENGSTFYFTLPELIQ